MSPSLLFSFHQRLFSIWPRKVNKWQRCHLWSGILPLQLWLFHFLDQKWQPRLWCAMRITTRATSTRSVMLHGRIAPWSRQSTRHKTAFACSVSVPIRNTWTPMISLSRNRAPSTRFSPFAFWRNTISVVFPGSRFPNWKNSCSDACAISIGVTVRQRLPVICIRYRRRTWTASRSLTIVGSEVNLKIFWEEPEMKESSSLLFSFRFLFDSPASGLRQKKKPGWC